MSQGKAWEKEKVIEVLRPLFELGYSVTKACKYAGIPQPTVATWILDDEELRLKINSWQNKVNIKARETLVQNVNEGSYSASKDWLIAMEPEDFGPKQKIVHAGDDDNPIVHKHDFSKMTKDELHQFLAQQKAD